MKNNFGSNISMTIFGESHGPCIGVTLDGLPAGFAIDLDRLHHDMEQRKAKGNISTQRHEEDQIHFLSGFYQGKTTGSPLTICIENKHAQSKDYASLHYQLRPSHADLSAFFKYNGYQDTRGGGHFSGRLSACIVAAGNICRQILESQHIYIGSHIEQLYQIYDRPFSEDIEQLKKEIKQMNLSDFAVLDASKQKEMIACIEQTALEKDSIGGVIETSVLSFPKGVGEPFFDSIESILSHLLFSIPAVKGVSFGSGFSFASLKGSQANDPIAYKDDFYTTSNHNGGINGGITNGMPLRIHTCIKPTASIYQSQKSVNYQTKENISLTIQGRHDPCILHRARVVIDCIIAFGLLDLLMSYQAIAPFQGDPLCE